MNTTLLEVKDLITEFRSEDRVHQAVRSISFTVNRGKTLGIVGESGSGKSVTSLSVMRLIPNPPGRIASGSIHFHEDDGSITDLLALPELDVTVQSTILDLMHDLQKKHNMGMMFITHDLGVIKDIADDIIVMYKGKIVEQGSVAEIFDNPQHPYTKGLLACRPRMDKKLHILPTVRDFMDETADGIITPKALAGATINDVIESNVISREEINQRNAELSAQKPILSVKNLEVHFPIRSGNVFGQSKGVVKAVDDISFDVYPGETLGLVGESGCGKTTTGRAILRLVEPTGGDIIVLSILA